MSSLRRWVGIALCVLGLQAVDASAQQVVCYAFSDGATQLVGLQGQGSTPSEWSTASNPIYSRSISGLPADAVESLYFDMNADRFYTVDQGIPQDPTPDRFGYLNLTSGTFVPISPSTGIGSGTRPGTTTTLVVGDNTGQTTGLAYDRTTQTLWGVTLSGHLYQIDIATGALVQNAFGTNEFARVRQGAGNGNGNAITAVEDISFAADGTMYVVTNTSGNSGPAKLYTVNKTGANPGQVTSVVDISVSGSAEDEFEGLSFGPMAFCMRRLAMAHLFLLTAIKCGASTPAQAWRPNCTISHRRMLSILNRSAARGRRLISASSRATRRQ